MPSFTRVLQFLYTHVSTNLGEGHKLMNCPMIPLSAKVREYLQVSSASRSIEGMLSNFLTNFYCESEVGRFLHAATIFLKASILGGRGGGGASGPPSWVHGERAGEREAHQWARAWPGESSDPSKITILRNTI
jgi:hypothetical protein